MSVLALALAVAALVSSRTAYAGTLLARSGDFCLVNSSMVPLSWSLCTAWEEEEEGGAQLGLAREPRAELKASFVSTKADLYASARLDLPLSRLRARWDDEEAMDRRYGPAALSLLREPGGLVSLDADFDTRLEWYLGRSHRSRRRRGRKEAGATLVAARSGCGMWPLGPPHSLPAIVSMWELAKDKKARVCFFPEGEDFRVVPATMDFARWLELYRAHDVGSSSPSRRFLVHGGDAQQDASCPLLAKARLAAARKHA